LGGWQDQTHPLRAALVETLPSPSGSVAVPLLAPALGLVVEPGLVVRLGLVLGLGLVPQPALAADRRTASAATASCL
jgi:hypothetical protein